MVELTLAALEEVIEPYRRAGYVIPSQSEGTITLVFPPQKFSRLIFLFALVLFWPAAIAYIVFFNNHEEDGLCKGDGSRRDRSERVHSGGRTKRAQS